MADLYASNRPPAMDAPPRTQPLPAADGYDGLRTGGDQQDGGEEILRDPVAAMRKPENRSKLWLVTAALTLLNTLLLLGLVVAQAGEDGPDPVVVDGTPCLVVEGEDAGTLFCQR